MMSVAPVDFQYHDTYFIVAHFHYTLVPASVFILMAAGYFWLPKWTGNMYNEKIGKLHFWLSAISVNILFFPQHFLGLAGMPRRIPDYAVQFADWNMVSSIGAFIYGFSQLLFVYIVIDTIRGGTGEKSVTKSGKTPASTVWNGPCLRLRLTTPLLLHRKKFRQSISKSVITMPVDCPAGKYPAGHREEQHGY